MVTSQSCQSAQTSELVTARNSAKSEIGKVSMQILNNINSKIRKTTRLNQWKNASDVTNWFTSIPDMQKHSFASFDIDSFYPSITESLLSKAVSFAKNYTTIKDKDIDIIMHCGKSLLFDKETAWTKKNHAQRHVRRNHGQLRWSVSLWAYRSFPPEQPQREIRQKQRRTLQRRRASTCRKRKRTTIRTD